MPHTNAELSIGASLVLQLRDIRTPIVRHLSDATGIDLHTSSGSILALTKPLLAKTRAGGIEPLTAELDSFRSGLFVKIIRSNERSLIPVLSRLLTSLSGRPMPHFVEHSD